MVITLECGTATISLSMSWAPDLSLRMREAGGISIPPWKWKSNASVGIDLGLKTTATCSDGFKLERRRITDEFAAELVTAQRANKNKRVKTIHARIMNSRSDAIHKFTTSMVKNYGAVFVGDVSSKALVKTKMAKSVLDTGWGMLKTQLGYKARARSVVFEEVNERNTTQMCSCCGEVSANSPKGRAGLGIQPQGLSRATTELCSCC